MIRLLAAALALALTAAGSLAAGDGPLNKNIIPADAKWLFHLDLDALRASKAGELLEDPFLERELGPQEREQLSRIRPVLRKLMAVTLYGNDNPDGAVILLRTTATADEFFAAMKCDESTHELIEQSVEAGAYTLRSWRIEGQTVFGFAEPGEAGSPLVLLSSDRDNLVEAIDTARGKQPSLADSGGQLDAAAAPRPGAALLIAATELQTLPRDRRASFLLEKARALRLEAGEHDGQMFAAATLTTDSEDSAHLIAELGRGLLATAQLQLAQDPSHAPLRGVLRALAISAEASTATLSLTYDAEKLMEVYREARSATAGSAGASDVGSGEIGSSPTAPKEPRRTEEPTGK